MTRKRDFNFALNLVVPPEDKDLIESWLKEVKISKSDFFVWAVKMFASEMRALDEIKPDEIKSGISWPVNVVWGLKEKKFTLKEFHKVAGGQK
jgi:hypothetical protein